MININEYLLGKTKKQLPNISLDKSITFNKFISILKDLDYKQIDVDPDDLEYANVQDYFNKTNDRKVFGICNGFDTIVFILNKNVDDENLHKWYSDRNEIVGISFGSKRATLGKMEEYILMHEFERNVNYNSYNMSIKELENYINAH